MNYLVFYECRKNGEVLSGNFKFESEHTPELSDAALINKELQESAKIHKTGIAGLSITSILLLS